MRLTRKEAEALYAENTVQGDDLVGGFMNFRRETISNMTDYYDEDDLRQEFRLAFWKACLVFDPVHGSISTLGYLKMGQRLIILRHKMFRGGRILRSHCEPREKETIEGTVLHDVPVEDPEFLADELVRWRRP